MARAHPYFSKIWENNGLEIRASAQLVPSERKGVYSPRCWNIKWTHVQRKSVVVSGRKQVDHWITEREKNLVGHFLIKCPIRRKELVFARQTVRQGVETTWYVRTRKRCWGSFKERVSSWFTDTWSGSVSTLVPECKLRLMCWMLTQSHRSHEVVIGNEIQSR